MTKEAKSTEPAGIDLLPEVSALFRHARRSIEKPALSLRVALLADTASQILKRALLGMAHFRSFQLDIFESEYDQIDLQILNSSSELHAFAPDTVIIYRASERLSDRFSDIETTARPQVSAAFLEKTRQTFETLSAKGCQVIFFNLANPGDGTFGNYGGKVSSSLAYQIRTINYELMRFAESNADFHVYDLDGLQTQLGRSAVVDPKLYCSSKISLTPEACRYVARDVIEMLAVRKGAGRKCIILDLDNTLWGGVIGDDGLDRIQLGELGLGPAFSRLQGWLKLLKERGVVLAVCSKNEDAVAREPFLKHPEMKLRLEDIAVFVANWTDKATNIRSIREVIDVDYGAMVFLDDNPAERALVRESFPAMTVPDLPADPCEYLPYLQTQGLFETASHTSLDAQRTQAYQVEVQRRSEREKFVDPGEFLVSLQMRASIRAFTSYDYPRIAQLTQRSNQFNLRTVRYTEKQIESLARSPAHRTLAIELKDKFGDYGLISVIIIERNSDSYFIDTWLMSCRVLNRGVEALALNQIVDLARKDHISSIIGEYLPTTKNGMVIDHYRSLGFLPLATNRWALETSQLKRLSCPIEVGL
jgi:FkbH-like protein